ncbi:MAG TPA: tetratricopeptide repeat protein [Terracidiphilus sp.]|nr:tetratricopeptide repeat protein [Terracidiphilus sp.]
MDTQTRHALKKDKFAQAAADSASWLSGHRSGVLRWVVVGVVILVLGVGALVFWTMRSSAADTALGAAMDTYNAPLAQPGLPAGNGIYSTAADRTKAANKQFDDVAQRYGWLPQGTKARYFSGITDEALGQNATAETELKAASGAWDHNLANLAKLALAGLYHQTARDSQAIDLYNAIIAKPSETVSASVAQLDLADLYAAMGKQDQARALWARVKDADKEGAAGNIATQKLAAKQ